MSHYVRTYRQWIKDLESQSRSRSAKGRAALKQLKFMEKNGLMGPQVPKEVKKDLFDPQSVL